MWTEYEDTLAVELARQHGLDAPGPSKWLAAIALVGVVRSFTTPEVRLLADAAGFADERVAALHAWVEAAVAQVEGVVSDDVLSTAASPRT
jgi:hypothetical protein